MRPRQWHPPRLGRAVIPTLVLALSAPVIALAHDDGGVPAPARVKSTLEASIFSYDGKDFVRTRTTLTTAAGKSAVNTKLDHDSPAYKALVDKRSYTGEATVFGRRYDANYAPLTSADGQVTGALFVAVAK
jgi:methyl-accepting chemotaxis protein-2 (aspartate sensor receptor)